MDMSPSTFWWVAAGVAVAAELATGTFYLLMFALGLVAAALAALLGFRLPGQLVAAALVGGGAVALWHWRRMQQPGPGPIAENRDVNIDIGERVHVTAWADDRTARVAYRGTTWAARLAHDAPAAPGIHRVRAVEGNWLVLTPATAD